MQARLVVNLPQALQVISIRGPVLNFIFKTTRVSRPKFLRPPSFCCCLIIYFATGSQHVVVCLRTQKSLPASFPQCCDSRRATSGKFSFFKEPLEGELTHSSEPFESISNPWRRGGSLIAPRELSESSPGSAPKYPRIPVFSELKVFIALSNVKGGLLNIFFLSFPL